MIYKTGVCNFCGTGCAHLMKVGEEAIRGVFASPGHPVSAGRLCVRGWHIHELLTTNERITRALVRKNGVLAETSFDEAVSLVADRLAAVPPEAVAFRASPRASNEDNYLLGKLGRAVFGTNNIDLASDSGQANTVDVLLESGGLPVSLASVADIRKAEAILVIGTDITKQNPILGSELHKAARNGARLVTLSSRVTQIAKLSGTHLQSKPGSKRIVLAAMAQVLIEDGLVDREFINANTLGFEGFARALAGLDLGRAAGLAGLEPESIRKAARLLAGAKSAMAVFASGISGLDRETIALAHNLLLAAGKVGREGCGLLPATGICNIAGSWDMGATPRFLPGYARAGDASAAERIGKLWSARLNGKPGRTVGELLAASPSPLKALVVADHDDGIIRHAEAIKGLDFVVYVGAFDNPFTRFAHVVLPAATYAETDGTYTNTERRIQLNRKKVEPGPGILPAWMIWAAVAAKRGVVWPYRASADVMAEIAAAVPAYSAVTYDKLEKGFGLQWPCDARHPEGCPRPGLGELAGRLSFAAVASDLSTPVPASDFTFLLTAGTDNYFWHTNNIMKKTHIPRREYNALLLLYPKGLVEISAEDAAKLGVRDKRPVKVVSASGSMQVAAKVSADVRPGSVYVPYFIEDMIAGFLEAHPTLLEGGEDSVVPVRIERV
jgi:predicted molibdopterin-dependent oxidoreductase YjgC